MKGSEALTRNKSELMRKSSKIKLMQILTTKNQCLRNLKSLNCLGIIEGDSNFALMVWKLFGKIRKKTRALRLMRSTMPYLKTLAHLVTLYSSLDKKFLKAMLDPKAKSLSQLTKLQNHLKD